MTKEKRCVDDMSGVYPHSDSTFWAADHYSRWIDLFHDGILWSAKLELLVDRSHDIPERGKNTDQWAQPECSTRSVVRWFRGRTPEQMAMGAALVGVASVGLGLTTSLHFDTPSGPSIVVAAVLFFLCSVVPLPRSS